MPSEPPIRILIVRIGAMGDVLHGLPAVTALKQRHPHWRVGWAIEPRWAPLLDPQVVDSVHLVPTRAWKERPFSPATLREAVILRRELRAQRYDVAIDLQGSIRSALIGRMAGAPRFIGSAHPRERQARALYTERLNLVAEHVIRQACELVGAAVGEVFTPAKLNIPTQDATEWFNREIGPQPYILLVPTAGWGAKQWPAERYAQLAKSLKAKGLRVLINAAPEAGPTAQTIAKASKSEPIACRIPELALLAQCATLVIGGDTGPVHLAAAQGTPVVALFGPTDPRRNGPNFVLAHTTVLRDASSTVDHRRHPETEAGLMKITVEDVLEASRAYLTARVDA